MKKGVDIFAGAGGMSLGAISSGIEIVLSIDCDESSVKTYKRNHPDTLVIQDDIKNIDPMRYIKGNDIYVVFGGPPCQGFSLANTKTRNTKNPNNKLFKEFVRFIDIISPEWFVFENVEGITNFNNGKTVKSIKRLFRKMGYSTQEAVLYASDYGVPQHRNRFFMVGNKRGISFEFPQKFNYTVNVEDAILDLPDLENGDSFEILPYKKNENLSSYALSMRKGSLFSTQNYVSRNKDYVIERYSYIKQGENWRAIPEELMGNYADRHNCHSGIYRRLDAAKPSVVISNYRKNMLIHPFANRGLSVREAARLQSFPDSFVFEGSLMHIQQQIGNAVPPLLAKVIFEQILSYGNGTGE